MKISILIVEDHPAMIVGYQSILSLNPLDCEVIIVAATNCNDAYEQILNNKNKFNLLLLDIILPPAEKLNIRSGLDLAKVARVNIPDAKIIILTSHTEAFILQTIIKSIDPEGLIVKSDCSVDELLEAFNVVIAGGKYVSETVKNSLKEILKRNNYLDTYNRQIISLLAQGIKTKNLPQYLNLSISAIDKRKVQIKDYFEIDKGTDEDIIREAKRCGFI